MPQATDEEDKGSRRTGSSLNIAMWWRKFHFSGRVIMCSVLLGLGLILIGGLIFAINVDDDSTKPNSDDPSNQVTTKAPSNFTGPVVMGIGGFIVTVGVIMCLFETQVCRKRTDDSSPLISEKIEDPEIKGSDPETLPSTSQGHKSHRHGTRKTTSPRKSKSHHAKSHSKERNQQKNSSPRSPPVSIEPPKGFMTSSEDNFLTPPNTLEGNSTSVKNDNSRDSDDKNSSLMKSFTSSGPSWNQSAEFLTPSTSFRDTSVSITNSVEIEENQEVTNFTKEFSEVQDLNSEYKTPLTVEEDRIQNLLIRVKNERKQMTGSKVETTENSNSATDLRSSDVQNEIIKKGSELSKNFEIAPTTELLSETYRGPSTSEDNQQKAIQVENSDELNQNKYETNTSEGSLKIADDEILKEISNEVINAAEEKKPALYDNQQGEISYQSDSTAPTNENNDDVLYPCSDKGTSHGKIEGKDEQVDLENSVSSDETVVSPDNFHENPINNDGASSGKATLLTLKKNSSDESKGLSASESPDNDTPAIDKDDVDHLNTHVNVPNSSEVPDLSHSKNSDMEAVANDIENVLKNQSS